MIYSRSLGCLLTVALAFAGTQARAEQEPAKKAAAEESKAEEAKKANDDEAAPPKKAPTADETAAKEQPEQKAVKKTKTQPAKTPAAGDELPVLGADELGSLLKGRKALAVDTSRPEMRVKLGVVPSAILITDPNTYNPREELPRIKGIKLVFYCVNETCKAAPTAAKKAQMAGFADVALFRGGILAWKKAGKPIRRVGEAQARGGGSDKTETGSAAAQSKKQPAANTASEKPAKSEKAAKAAAKSDEGASQESKAQKPDASDKAKK